MAHPPLTFDRATGVLEGANAWERLAALALLAGSRVSSNFSYRGYNRCANALRKMLPARDIAIRLNEDATFSFPYGDGYWSKLLDRSYHYETEIELLLRGLADVDFVMVDCGANYGYWSVLVSSAPFGAHPVIAIEPSSNNFARLAVNAAINGNRIRLMQNAIGRERGTARLSGSKHEALSIVGSANGDGEQVDVISLDSLLDSGALPAAAKYMIKLDVEGVEIDALKGASRLLAQDSIVLCEEHGQDRTHAVSRYMLEHTDLKLSIYDPRSGRFEAVESLAILDRIKVASNVGYNVFGTASPFWQERLARLNAGAGRTAH